MFESYDLKQFGEKIKNLRTSLGFSQAMVSKETGINIDTIRKIENGYSIPRYDTLVQLSLCYKTDIHKILASYQRCNLLFDFYKKLDYLINYGKFEEIKNLHECFLSELSKSNDLRLITVVELEQINCLILAVSSRYKKEINSALETIRYAFNLTIPEFTYERYADFRYSSLEIRLLVVAAACLGDIRKCSLSISISEFIISLIDIDLFSDKSEDSYVIKSLANISYNYHRLDNHEKALEYAKKGIDLSLEKGLLDMLHFLFLRLAVAQLRLGISEYMDSFKKCLYVLKIGGDQAHYDHMVEIIRSRYSLNFTEL